MREMALKAVLLIAAGALLMAGMRLAEWAVPAPERTINLKIQQEETEGPQRDSGWAERREPLAVVGLR